MAQSGPHPEVGRGVGTVGSPRKFFAFWASPSRRAQDFPWGPGRARSLVVRQGRFPVMIAKTAALTTATVVSAAQAVIMGNRTRLNLGASITTAVGVPGKAALWVGTACGRPLGSRWGGGRRTSGRNLPIFAVSEAT